MGDSRVCFGRCVFFITVDCTARACRRPVSQSSTKEATKLREMSELQEHGASCPGLQPQVNVLRMRVTMLPFPPQTTSGGGRKLREEKKIVKFINTVMMFMSECDIYFFCIIITFIKKCCH